MYIFPLLAQSGPLSNQGPKSDLVQARQRALSCHIDFPQGLITHGTRSELTGLHTCDTWNPLAILSSFQSAWAEFVEMTLQVPNQCRFDDYNMNVKRINLLLHGEIRD
jgi:hypothetical protein